MSYFSKDRLISNLRQTASPRVLGIGLAVLVASFAFTAQADAGVIVASDLTVGGSVSPNPASPDSDSSVDAREIFAFALGATSDTGGMGSSSQSGGSTSTGAVSMAADVPLPPTACLVSRLSLFSRISLPDPVEGRFFRPPR